MTLLNFFCGLANAAQQCCEGPMRRLFYDYAAAAKLPASYSQRVGHICKRDLRITLQMGSQIGCHCIQRRWGARGE